MNIYDFVFKREDRLLEKVHVLVVSDYINAALELAVAKLYEKKIRCKLLYVGGVTPIKESVLGIFPVQY